MTPLQKPKSRLEAHAPECARCKALMKVRILIPGRKVDDVSLREVRIRGFAFRAACVVSLTPILSTPPGSAMNSRRFIDGARVLPTEG